MILYNYELNSHLNLSLTELDFLYNMKADIPLIGLIGNFRRACCVGTHLNSNVNW